MFHPARPPLMWSSEAKRTRDQIGLLERSRSGGDEAEAFGRHARNRQKGQRIERRHGMAALQRLDRMLRTAKWSAMKNASKRPRSSVWAKRLRCARIEIGVREGAGIAPGAGVDRRRTHERAEPQLSFLRHEILASGRRAVPAAHCKTSSRRTAGGARSP